MRQYEVTFVVGPVLPKNEVEEKAKKYTDLLKENGCEIVHIDNMGLRQLAYPIKKFNSGYYYCIEFQSENGVAIDPVELAMRRDEELLRFLTVHLDKYGIKYNEDKREGKIGVARKIPKKDGTEGGRGRGRNNSKAAAKPAPAAKPATEANSEGGNKDAAKKEAAKPATKAAAPVAAAAPTASATNKAAADAPAAKAPEAAAKDNTTATDNLVKIEGIGPKIASLLTDAGIGTFAQLAATDAAKVKEILAAAGSRFTMHDPTTWGTQAKLAADGKWDELKKLQDELDGGKAAKGSDEEE